MISFKPEQVTAALLEALPERARDVLQKRYGLNKNGETFTLEAIDKVTGSPESEFDRLKTTVFSLSKNQIFIKNTPSCSMSYTN